MKTDIKDKRFKKIEITDAMRKEYGLCEHNEVNYKTLEKFCKELFLRGKSDKKQFKILAQDIRLKNQHIKDLKKMNEMMIDKYEDKFEEYDKANEDLKKANTQLILDVEDLKQRLFGHYERKLKNFALRPDRKKDN
jgi:inorganic pyrophosphatase